MHVSESFDRADVGLSASRYGLRQLLTYQVDVVSVRVLIIRGVIDQFDFDFGHVVSSVNHMSNGSLLDELIVTLQKVGRRCSFTLLCDSCRNSVLTAIPSINLQAKRIAFIDSFLFDSLSLRPPILVESKLKLRIVLLLGFHKRLEFVDWAI